MNQKRGKEAAKQAVLRELELLAEDRHPRNQTLITRFARCIDYQNASRLLIEGLGAARRQKDRPSRRRPVGFRR